MDRNIASTPADAAAAVVLPTILITKVIIYIVITAVLVVVDVNVVIHRLKKLLGWFFYCYLSLTFGNAQFADLAYTHAQRKRSTELLLHFCGTFFFKGKQE